MSNLVGEYPSIETLPHNEVEYIANFTQEISHSELLKIHPDVKSDFPHQANSELQKIWLHFRNKNVEFKDLAADIVQAFGVPDYLQIPISYALDKLSKKMEKNNSDWKNERRMIDWWRYFMDKDMLEHTLEIGIPEGCLEESTSSVFEKMNESKSPDADQIPETTEQDIKTWISRIWLNIRNYQITSDHLTAIPGTPFIIKKLFSIAIDRHYQKFCQKHGGIDHARVIDLLRLASGRPDQMWQTMEIDKNNRVPVDLSENFGDQAIGVCNIKGNNGIVSEGMQCLHDESQLNSKADIIKIINIAEELKAIKNKLTNKSDDIPRKDRANNQEVEISLTRFNECSDILKKVQDQLHFFTTQLEDFKKILQKVIRVNLSNHMENLFSKEKNTIIGAKKIHEYINIINQSIGIIKQIEPIDYLNIGLNLMLKKALFQLSVKDINRDLNSGNGESREGLNITDVIDTVVDSLINQLDSFDYLREKYELVKI